MNKKTELNIKVISLLISVFIYGVNGYIEGFPRSIEEKFLKLFFNERLF